MFTRLLLLFLATVSITIAYLPQPDLTNSIYSHDRIGHENSDGELPELEVESENPEEAAAASPYRSKLTFRRRNINAGGGPYSGSGPSPFSRMAYKTGYGSNRKSPMGRVSNNFYGNGLNQRSSAFSQYPSNNYGGPYGSYGSGGGGDSYSSVPRAAYSSGLMGNGAQKNMGYYGSTHAVRNNKNYKQRPFESRSNAAGYPSNDLMSSFSAPSTNHNGGGYPSPTRFPFGGNGNTFIPRFPEAPGRFPEVGGGYPSPYESSFPSSSYRGEMDPYALQIATNQWGSKSRLTAKDDVTLDGYADANKKAAAAS